MTQIKLLFKASVFFFAFMGAAPLLVAVEPKIFQGAAPANQPVKESPLTAEEQLATFSLPEEFKIELVAADPDANKVVAINFDAAGKLWAVTATEYPLDGNENAERALELYKNGGKDRVLVFETPTQAGRQIPRTFADHLAMPMAVLPFRDGVIIGHGQDILFLHDTDGDGKADQREVLLTGFGIQDSHLMPHQFTRGPGGWIYMAQGAFNSSQVKTKDGKVTPFDQCKLARFKPDGSQFEIVGWGLNNIWGLVLDRRGEMFIQEANDLGYPVVPFFLGGSYPGIGNHKSKPYSPWQPPLADFEMGGTGLSGLALAEDANGFPPPYRDVMYVANPITGKIQAIQIHPVGAHYRLEKLPDFINCSDPWFRPVAIQFGPDGCLYIVDWYNKIISHNEVPRNHPERDKMRTRIWRVRHESMPQRKIPDLTRVPENKLIQHLAAGSTWESRAAWQQIVDRKATGLAPKLKKSIESKSSTVDSKIRALWALEGLEKVEMGTLEKLTKAPDRDLRREAVRVLGTWKFPAHEIIGVLEPLLDDADPQVRAEVIRTIDAWPNPDAKAVERLIRMGKPQMDGPKVQPPQARDDPTFTGDASDRAFERSLVRAALEKHPQALANFLDAEAGKSLPLENRLLAFLALDGKSGAVRLVESAPEMKRNLTEEELGLLCKFPNEPKVEKALSEILQNPVSQTSALHSLLKLRGPSQDSNLHSQIAAAAKALLTREPGDPNRDLFLAVAAAFRLSELEPEVVGLTTQEGQTPQRQLAGLKALREMGANQLELFQRFAISTKASEAVRGEAIKALASAKNERAVSLLVEAWPVLPAGLRKTAVDRLTSSETNSRALLRAIKNGDIAKEELDPYALEKLKTILGDDADLAALQKELAARAPATGETPELKAKFDRIRQSTQRPGDVAKGKVLFASGCLLCHNVHGEGGNIGPTLNGAGAMDAEALFRSVLVPNAAIESGYYRYRVETKENDLLEGLLVSQNEKEIVLRQAGNGDLRIAREKVKRASFSKTSMMPDGLLDTLAPEDVANLFAYLRTLK